uniref:Uncharacterized protein n=1 Tax=Anguilla anguilla TaxID=7936 RepID=A0A0E9SRW1_ANGAN
MFIYLCTHNGIYVWLFIYFHFQQTYEKNLKWTELYLDSMIKFN